MYASCMQMKKHLQKQFHKCLIIRWTLLGMIQRPSDYESDALTN
jgi:hypothetical protein